MQPPPSMQSLLSPLVGFKEPWRHKWNDIGHICLGFLGYIYTPLISIPYRAFINYKYRFDDTQVWNPSLIWSHYHSREQWSCGRFLRTRWKIKRSRGSECFLPEEKNNFHPVREKEQAGISTFVTKQTLACKTHSNPQNTLMHNYLVT